MHDTRRRNSDWNGSQHPNRQRSPGYGRFSPLKGGSFSNYGEDASSDDAVGRPVVGMPTEPHFASMMFEVGDSNENVRSKDLKRTQPKSAKKGVGSAAKPPTRTKTSAKPLLDTLMEQALIVRASEARDTAPRIQLDEILTANAVEAGALDENVTQRSINDFYERLESLTKAAKDALQAQCEGAATEVIDEAWQLFDLHVSRNDHGAVVAVNALVNMRKWERSEHKRIERFQQLERLAIGSKNGVESGYDPVRKNRLLQYQCIGASLGAAEDDAPRCQGVFAGKSLTGDGRVDVRMGLFSALTMGLCPSCLRYYQVQPVSASLLVEKAEGNVRTRACEQQWTEPTVRPSTGVSEIHFSDKLEGSLLAHKKKLAKHVAKALDDLQGALERCAERLERSNPNDHLWIVKEAHDNISDQIRSFSSDDMSDEQWEKMGEIRRFVVELLRAQEARVRPEGKVGGCSNTRRGPSALTPRSARRRATRTSPT